MLRLDEPGWVEIGKRCSVGRRSLWMRSTDMTLELCAGREGDDSYLLITRDHPLFAELLEVMSTARFAATT